MKHPGEEYKKIVSASGARAVTMAKDLTLKVVRSGGRMKGGHILVAIDTSTSLIRVDTSVSLTRIKQAIEKNDK